MSKGQAPHISVHPLLTSDNTILAIIIFAVFIIAFSIQVDTYWLSVVLPAAVTASYFIVFQLRLLYRLLFFFIPISAEVQLSGGLSTDLIGEPILWLFFVTTFIFILWQGIPKKAFSLLSLVLFFHIGWIVYTSIFSHHPTISLKYALAKSWYILPFYLLPYYIVDHKKDIRSIFKYFIIGTLVAALYFFIQHYQLGLSYLTRTNAGQPIWRNHVNYAATLVITLPLYWYLYKSSLSPNRWMYIIGALSALIFMHFAFARITYLCMVAALIYALIIRLKLTRLSIVMALIAVTSGTLWLQHNNQYLEIAPDYNKAIMQTDFENKISATTSGQDISTMERVHRWVAGANMVADEPITGVGPSNFYETYKPYSVFSFETYVSDNPERSGIHNYYLMVLVEQGWIGLFIFLVLIIIAFFKLEDLYHSTQSKERKQLLLCLGATLMMIVTINTVNDMIEVIKIGGIFFFVLSIISYLPFSKEQL